METVESDYLFIQALLGRPSKSRRRLTVFCADQVARCISSDRCIGCSNFFKSLEMDGIWRSAGVSLCIYLEVCMMFCSISGGGSHPLSGESEFSGLCSGRDNVAGASSEVYIGEVYFKKYDNLDDSHFRNVVEQGLSGCSCGASGMIPKVSLLDRYLVGEGSHRRLSTTFTLELPTGVQPCEVIYVERLPLGVFADPFELQHLQQRGVFKKASVFGDTNLELPSFLSNRSLVEVHMDVDPNSLSNKVDFNLELPLHGRYQPLDDSGYTNVEFGVPDIFLHCKIDDGLGIKTCVSVLKDDGSIQRPKAIIWSLPSGIRAHEGVVSVITFSSAILSTLIIVFEAMQQRHSGI